MILEATRWVTPDNGPRPAGSPDECFYCQRALGLQHAGDCVLFRRSVVVRAVAEYVVEVPVAWTPDQVRFHRNESTWCVDNGARELLALKGQGCFCGLIRYEYVRDAAPSDGAAAP